MMTLMDVRWTCGGRRKKEKEVERSVRDHLNSINKDRCLNLCTVWGLF